jgi:WD40 repeat protein
MLQVRALAVLADGRVVSCGDDRMVRVWDLAGGAARVLEGHRLAVSALAVLPDGRVVSGSDDRTVRVWDLVGGGVRVLEGHRLAVSALAVLADGRVVSGGDDHTVRVWDLAYGAKQQQVFVADAPVTCLAVVSGAERIVAGCADGTVHFLRWD